MECIEINVRKETAQKWREASPNIKAQIEKSFEEQINAVLLRMAEADFDRVLKEIREEAKETGLTPEILQEILDE